MSSKFDLTVCGRLPDGYGFLRARMDRFGNCQLALSSRSDAVAERVLAVRERATPLVAENVELCVRRSADSPLEYDLAGHAGAAGALLMVVQQDPSRGRMYTSSTNTVSYARIGQSARQS